MNGPAIFPDAIDDEAWAHARRLSDRVNAIITECVRCELDAGKIARTFTQDAFPARRIERLAERLEESARALRVCVASFEKGEAA